MGDHAKHDHIFGQDLVRSGERRTIVVVALTAAMMAVEIAAGALFENGTTQLLVDTGDMDQNGEYVYYMTKSPTGDAAHRMTVVENE